MSPPDVIDLHRRLVETPSVSGNEEAITAIVAEILEPFGEVCVLDHGVVARKGNGPKTILNSHLDTVPPSENWTSDPYKVVKDGEKIIGLGSNDAKASVAAMMAAFCATEEPCILILGHQEETTGIGTWSSLHWTMRWAEQILGAVVGEPTQLEIGTAQKGLLIINLVAKGDSVHAARAMEMNSVNAIKVIADDIQTLSKLQLGLSHPQLGRTTIQPTVIKGGDIHNRLPHEVTLTLDIRTVPVMTHDEFIEAIQAAVNSEVVVHSQRLEPYSCPEDSLIVQAALRARPASKLFGSATMSDQVAFRGIPCIKCGPGVSTRSHTPDEFVMENEIKEGFDFYMRLLNEANQA